MTNRKYVIKERQADWRFETKNGSNGNGKLGFQEMILIAKLNNHIVSVSKFLGSDSISELEIRSR